MKEVPVIWVVIIVYLIYLGNANLNRCGQDMSGKGSVKEGLTKIEHYPWLGLLFYPHGPDADLITSTIVLITKQIALAAASDIERYPKHNFRARSRVVLGHNCTGPYIGVKDYNYHPDYTKSTYSSLAMIQLDTSYFTLDVSPICPPPPRSRLTQVYAMSLTQDCSSKSVKIYKMEYVDENECKEFYRRADLDFSSLWPTHVTCARATHGGHCVWQSGTALVTRDNNNQWRLLGFGVNGPGCESAARFLDYGMYEPWVKQSIERIGRPAITRISKDHLILRRSITTFQRFGTCDPEETKTELFSDTSSFKPEPYDCLKANTISYNLTLVTNVDYSCVALRVISSRTSIDTPIIRLRRVCQSKFPKCYDFSVLQIDFRIIIHFFSDVEYKVSAYGREIRMFDIKLMRKYVNKLYYGEGNVLIPEVVMVDNNYTRYFLNNITTNATTELPVDAGSSSEMEYFDHEGNPATPKGNKKHNKTKAHDGQ